MQRSFLNLIAILFALLTFSPYLSAKIPTAEQMLFNSAQGKDFFIAVPPSECDGGQPIPYYTVEIALEFYITSSKNCTVSLEMPGMGYKVTKPVKAMMITTFSSIRDEVKWDWEVRTSEKVLETGIWIHADQPISVYCLNHRAYSGEGYLAIPISACGTDYIHLGYYDFAEAMVMPICPRGGGFIITAGEDNTKVNIQLKGFNEAGNLGRTLGGHKIGDSWQVTLNKGQIYCVMGDGQTRKQFDISGSRVTSNKPIGMISFHKRTLMPQWDLYNGRNPLCEMIPPVTAWGKKYVTVEYKRQNKGDFFRIIASQDNTNFTVKWYDLLSSNLIGQRSGRMKKSGDFFEYEEVFVPQNETNTLESIKGTSVWEADKPVLVMQYSYSQNWDMDVNFDPFMILVVPVEQFIPGTVFQTPDAAAGFLNNYFNIVAVGDTNDFAQKNLQSIKLDGKPITLYEPAFIFNRIPTTNLYWAKITVQPGAHRIVGNGQTKFGGYIYGFSSADGYGWPAAMAINKVDETDTLPPQLYRTGDCGDFDFRTTEFRNGKAGDDPRQVDQGIASVELLDSSYNYELIYIDSLITYPPLYEFRFALKVKDKTKKAFAIFIINDRAGNFTIDSVAYEPASFNVAPNPIVFGNVRLRTTKSLKATITNTSDSTIEVLRIALLNGTIFKITGGDAPPPIQLASKESRDVLIDYTPVTEGITPDQKDFDSLLVETRCLNFSWPIEGRGVIPKILVEDWDFGSVIVNQKACKENQQSKVGLTIQNVGSDTLVIWNIKNFVTPFELSTPFTPSLPIIIPPNSSPIYLVSVCFAPTAIGDYTIDVLFESNAEGVDSISTLKGRGIQPGPYVTDKNWFKRRVKTVNDSVVFVRNAGTSRVRVTGLNLGTASNDMEITGAIPMPSVASPIDLIPEDSTYGTREIVVNVRFKPQSEATFHNTVVPEFDPNAGVPPGSVFGNLDGIGILPKLEIIGFEFLPPILVGTTHPVQGFVTLKSTSTSADLYVDEIRWKNPAQNQFAWVGNLPAKFQMLMGSSITIPLTFTARGVNKQVEIVEVVSDASEGPNPNPLVVRDTVVIGYGIDKGLKTDSVNYGLVMLCDQPVKQFHVTNTGTTIDAVVQGFNFVSGDVAAFEILTPTPQTLKPGQTMSFDVRFKPYLKTPLIFSALVQVYSSADSSQYVLLQGSADSMQVRFSLKKYSEDDKLQPGMMKEIDIRADILKGNWAEAKVTSIHVEMLYNKAWMIYNKVIDKIGLDATWTVTANEVSVDKNIKKLVIDANGTTPVQANGTLFRPYFMLLLFEDNQFVPTINDVASTFGVRDVCVNRISIPGYVIMNTCVRNLRSILTAGANYALQEIDPNPASSGKITLRYDVGLKGMTRIEIINSMSEVVRTLINEEKEIGNYESVIPIEGISSGNYFIRMNSGPFSDVKQLIIAK